MAAIIAPAITIFALFDLASGEIVQGYCNGLQLRFLQDGDREEKFIPDVGP